MPTIAGYFKRAPAGWAALLALVSCVSASAQSAAPIQGVTTTIEGLTLADTVTQLVRPVGATHVGEALGLATELEVGTMPFGASSGGFVIKLDPSTGLQVRTATTFGPSFAERALTSGEGNVSVGVNFMSSTYDRLYKQSLNALQLRSVVAVSPKDGRLGVTDLTLTANTVVMSGRMGITDNLDVGVSVPIVTVKVKGTSSLFNGNGGNGDMILFGQGTATARDSATSPGSPSTASLRSAPASRIPGGWP